jgi:hypothetical protein
MYPISFLEIRGGRHYYGRGGPIRVAAHQRRFEDVEMADTALARSIETLEVDNGDALIHLCLLWLFYLKGKEEHIGVLKFQ